MVEKPRSRNNPRAWTSPISANSRTVSCRSPFAERVSLSINTESSSCWTRSSSSMESPSCICITYITRRFSSSQEPASGATMDIDVSKALMHDNASHEVISRIESPTLQRAASSRFCVAETRQVLSTKKLKNRHEVDFEQPTPPRTDTHSNAAQLTAADPEHADCLET